MRALPDVDFIKLTQLTSVIKLEEANSMTFLANRYAVRNQASSLTQCPSWFTFKKLGA